MASKTTKGEAATRQILRFLRETDGADAFDMRDILRAKDTLNVNPRLRIGVALRKMVARGEVEELKVQGMGGGLTFYALREGGRS
jgi:hypothetical protein